MTSATVSRVEKTAADLRAMVRKKAGLEPRWDEASDSMRDWYRGLARRMIENAEGMN